MGATHRGGEVCIGYPPGAAARSRSTPGRGWGGVRVGVGGVGGAKRPSPTVCTAFLHLGRGRATKIRAAHTKRSGWRPEFCDDPLRTVRRAKHARRIYEGARKEKNEGNRVVSPKGSYTYALVL